MEHCQEAHPLETGAKEALSGQERPEPGVIPAADPLIPGGQFVGYSSLWEGPLCTLSSPQKMLRGLTPPGPRGCEVAGAFRH